MAPKVADKDIAQQIRQFEREATAERRAARELREDAVGLLTPALLRKHIKSGQALVLAYGRKGHTVEFTVDDLRRFVKANQAAQKQFRKDVRGVPLLMLERTSLPIDVRRSKEVKSAQLYKVSRNMLYFSVSGNSKPKYQVRIRMEDWDTALHSSYATTLTAAKVAATGRISFDCSCGRHQFWYRYLTHIGGFDINPPTEQDFPKIRNPGLRGCCCKHVLKVLRLMKTNAVQAFLSKEIERQSATIGFADSVRARFLKAEEVRGTGRARGTTKDGKEAKAAYRRFLREAGRYIRAAQTKQGVKDLQKKLKPKGSGKQPTPAKQTPQITPAVRAQIVDTLRNLRVAVKLNLPGFTMKTGLANIAKKYKVQIQYLEDTIKQEGL